MDMIQSIKAVKDFKKEYLGAITKSIAITKKLNDMLLETKDTIGQIKDMISAIDLSLKLEVDVKLAVLQEIKYIGADLLQDMCLCREIECVLIVNIQTNYLAVLDSIQSSIDAIRYMDILLTVHDEAIQNILLITGAIEEMNPIIVDADVDDERVDSFFKRVKIFAKDQCINFIMGVKDNVKDKVDKVINQVNKLKGNIKLAFDIKQSIIPKIKAIGRSLIPLRQTVNIAIKAKDMTKKVVKGVGSKLKELALGGITKLGTDGIEKAKELARQSLEGAINRQAKQTGMEKVISQNNNGMSEQDVKAKSDGYMKTLKKTSNNSVYSEGEVLDAGSNALKMAKGDTGEAEKFLKLAEDMAGSNSGKTLMEAMDALTEAQSGNLDALKEFGVNATEESLKNAGGNILNMKNDSGSTMTEQFKGGAEEAGKTIPGQIAKLKGMGETILADIASTSLGGISDILGKGVEFLSANQEKITQFGLTISKVVGDAFNYVFSVIQAGKPILDTFMNFIFSKKDVFMDMFGNIMGIVDQFKAAWAETWPVVQEMLVGAWEIIEPILSVWIDYIGALIGFIAQIARIVIKVFIGVVLPVIQKVFNFIQPVVSKIIGYVLKFYEGIIGLYNLITDFLKNIFKEDVPERTVTGTATNDSSTDMITGLSSNNQTMNSNLTTNPMANKATASMTNSLISNDSMFNEDERSSYVSYNDYTTVLNQDKTPLNPVEKSQLSLEKKNNQISITIPKLADNISVSDSKDVDKLLSRLEEKLMSVALNMGVV